MPGWLGLLSIYLRSGHGLAVHEFQPRIGLCADSLEPGSLLQSLCLPLSLSLSLSAPPLLMFCLSLSQNS